jgi:hypothetical protein
MDNYRRRPPMEGFSRPGELGGEAFDDDSVEGHIMDERDDKPGDTTYRRRIDEDPDTSYRRRLDEDDTEGHGVGARKIDDEDDTEGHGVGARKVDDDDTEGHSLTKRS